MRKPVLGGYPSTLSTFKHLVMGLEQDDTVTFTVSDLERFILEAINEALSKQKKSGS